MKRINKAPEARMIAKVRSMIEGLYPGIEEQAREIFVHQNEAAMKIIKRKVDFRLAFHAWFLLKYEFPSEATAMEMADSFPLDFFTKNEKKMIKQFLGYKESLFEILHISPDKRNYAIKDLLDKKNYLIKTLDLPAKFEEGQLIRALIIKNLGKEYFFYGAIQSYNIKQRSAFIKDMLGMIRFENALRDYKKGGVVEWEIDKGRTSRQMKDRQKQETK
ncbi:MAG TPA: hypothetical protein VJK51_00165 [Candidatus Nanoarchaeia archaeon]|nr:hypothetical protein [Candidatus Nanoarchaeia archaeon]